MRAEVLKMYDYLFLITIIILLILLFFVIIKSIIGPKVADRIVAINMLSTIVLMIICTLTIYYKNEGYLSDVALIYCLISFVAILVLSNIFINVNIRKKFKSQKGGKENE